MTVGVVVVALSARVTATIPGADVPQSAQTLAVLVVGSLLGARDGALTLTAYLRDCRRNRRPSLCRRWVGVGALGRADRRVSTGLCRGSRSGRSISRPRPAPARVFAGGGSGWAHLVGPTAGYLLGFVAAAAVAGRLADRGLLRRFGPAIAVMICGHALILTLGWLRLAWMLGATPEPEP